MKSTVSHAEQQPACTQAANGADLRELIENAAHLLPAQGPITSFVHHNTLHAFEHLPFERAVVEGANTFGCHPYLPEEQYRKLLQRGRIRPEDIEATLIDDLGDRADELLGFLGTRFHLRQAMLRHPLYVGPTAESNWVIAETDALRSFRQETPSHIRDDLINQTRHWIMHDLRTDESDRGDENVPPRVRGFLSGLFVSFDKSDIEQWPDETWEAFCLHLLWQLCFDGARRVGHDDLGERNTARPTIFRHRDLLLEATGEDTDMLVHDLLIRYCGAFLDQGFGGWSLPGRAEGFYRSFLSIYSQPGGPADHWLRGLRVELRRVVDSGMSPLESIQESLQLLGVSEDETEQFLTQTLLALRGYAGMIWQMETRGDRVACPVLDGSLVEFLAIRLILDRLAIGYVAKQSQIPLAVRAEAGDLSELRVTLRGRISPHKQTSVDQRAFLLFQLAQLLGWDPQTLRRLSDAQWTRTAHEVEAFSGIERRRIYQLAFERHYRINTLDAVAAHASTSKRFSEYGSARKPKGRPTFQIMCCIDEREESFRRHLEEATPDCETFGVAGFFAVAMYYRGAADAHYTPLCPVIIQPQHYVKEDVVYSLETMDRRRRETRRSIGTVTHRVHVGSRTFAGGWIAAVLGSLASLPLVMRILFPRATAQLRTVFGSLVQPPSVTRMQLEREHDPPGDQPGHIGYSVVEMATAVEKLLQDIGLTRCISRLVVVMGHGSSSLNNPHEAAHDCGACGGGRGGPNARAFAQMANDPRVRDRLAAKGLKLDDDCVFVGAYHNTCDDSVTWYDLDRLPVSHRTDFEFATGAIDVARKRSAHERCRRFETAPLNLSKNAALRHVEGRAEDLSQVRPEYGHASNALCFVGCREWSRGLFLDRRAFLQSYDPAQDDEQHTILQRILQAVIPVCAGINLEYYFSYVDPTGYGCGTKLPHNIASLLGVMNGAVSDLRPGLPWQMVEIHEPVRLLFVIETTPAAIEQIVENNAGIAQLVRGNWVQLATFDAETSKIILFRNGQFEPYTPESSELPIAASSTDWYRGWRDHLGFASIYLDAATKSIDSVAADQEETLVINSQAS